MKRTTTSDGPFFTVNRTLTGTLSEAATIVMLVVGWGLILTALVCPASLSTGPETWLDTSLTFRDRAGAVTFGGIDTYLALYALWAAYHPLSRIEMPMTITAAEQLRNIQEEIARCTYTRAMGVCLAAAMVSGVLAAFYLPCRPAAETAIIICLAAMGTNAAAAVVCVYRRCDRSKTTRLRILNFRPKI